jgi:hypothetical protein
MHEEFVLARTMLVVTYTLLRPLKMCCTMVEYQYRLLLQDLHEGMRFSHQIDAMANLNLLLIITNIKQFCYR